MGCIGRHEPWLCVLCLPLETRGVGLKARQVHEREVHGLKRGDRKRGMTVPRGKHLRQTPVWLRRD